MKIKKKIYNERGTWALVDEEGKIIETFRTNQAARAMIGYYQKKHVKKLEIKQIKPNKFKPHLDVTE